METIDGESINSNPFHRLLSVIISDQNDSLVDVHSMQFFLPEHLSLLISTVSVFLYISKLIESVPFSFRATVC